MTLIVDSWSPHVYGTPTDGVELYQQFGLTQWPICYVIVSKTGGGGELFWTGTAFEPFDAAHYADYVLPGTSPRPLHWAITIPWSRLGSGLYAVRACTSFNGSPGPGDRVFTNGKPQFRHVTGPRSPNPAGVIVGSGFGGTDALRVVDAGGNPIAGVNVEATVMPVGNNVVFARGVATTDAGGRWTLDQVCQPLTEHYLDFSKAGFTFTRQIITTGASV